MDTKKRVQKSQAKRKPKGKQKKGQRQKKTLSTRAFELHQKPEVFECQEGAIDYASPV